MNHDELSKRAPELTDEEAKEGEVTKNTAWHRIENFN
jgi:hypothetical protein